MQAEVKTDTAGYLHTVLPFAALKTSVLSGIAEHAQVRTEKKGTLLFYPDAKNDKFYIVRSGWVKLFRETMGGDEAIIDILNAGHCFGEIGLSGVEPMPYGAQVIEDACIISLPRFLLADEIMRNSVFGLAVLQSMTRQRMRRDLEIEHRTVQTAPQRIGCFLLKFCAGRGEGEMTLHLPYEKAVIASRLGMTPETFSRALGQLKAAQGLTVRGGTVTIPSVRALADFSCIACSSSFPCKEPETLA